MGPNSLTSAAAAIHRCILKGHFSKFSIQKNFFFNTWLLLVNPVGVEPVIISFLSLAETSEALSKLKKRHSGFVLFLFFTSSLHLRFKIDIVGSACMSGKSVRTSKSLIVHSCTVVIIV